MSKSTVYFIKEITPNNLIKIYKALGRELRGNVGVKISTGEMGGHNYLKPELIGDLVDSLNGTIVECCTAYGGSRQEKDKHWATIDAHGFRPRFKVDLMDEFGQIDIPVHNGFHLDKDIVGEHLNNYDSLLILSHFKGHMMGGFGGALKNISIGIGSTAGKAYIHSAGTTTSSIDCWDKNAPKQDDFLESRPMPAKRFSAMSAIRTWPTSTSPTASPSIATAILIPTNPKWVTLASSLRSTPLL